jgi:hypothetical protein
VQTHRRLASIPNACVRRVIVPLPLATGGSVATTQRRILAEAMSDTTDPSLFSLVGEPPRYPQLRIGQLSRLPKRLR